MDFRRIIAFGKSSHVVSLPKAWLLENKLKKGDLVYLDQDFDKLLITPKEKEDERKEKKAIIHVDGKELRRIKREISSAFVNYNDYIVVEGKELYKNSKGIIKIIQNLIALEIMDQSSDKITARDFLRVEDIKIKDYFHKEDIITRSIFTDLMNTSFTAYEELIERQNSVRRVYLLLLKVFKAISKDSMLIKKSDLRFDELFRYYRFNFSIQRIAHSLKVMAESLQNVKDKKVKKQLSEFISFLHEHYKNVMKSVHNLDDKKAYELSMIRDQRAEEINSSNIKRTLEVNVILERIVWVYFELQEMLHTVYN